MRIDEESDIEDQVGIERASRNLKPKEITVTIILWPFWETV